MKKISLILAVIFLISLFSCIPGWAKTDYEIVFSENFEGDLSRWRLFYEGGKQKDSQKNKYIGCYLEMGIAKDQLTDTKLPRAESTPFPVEGGKIYTVMADMCGMDDQVGYLVFLDEKGHRLDDKGYKFQNNIKSSDWQCGYSYVEAPEEAKKASVILMGGKAACNFDNVIVCKDRVGISSDFDSREKYGPQALSNSITEAQKHDIVFSQTFEEGTLDDWTYSDRNSSVKIRKNDANAYTGRKSLTVKNDTPGKTVGITTPSFMVIPNFLYEFSADIYKQGIGNNSVELIVNFYSEKGEKLESFTLKADASDWESCKLSLTVPEKAVTGNILIEGGNGTAVSYVDNIFLINKTVRTSEEEKLEKIKKSSVIIKTGTSNALSKGVKTLIDENNSKVVPLIIDSRTLVPVRFLASNFDFKVSWEETTKTVTLSKEDKSCKIVLGNKEIELNGEKIISDTPAISIEGRTMLPLRILCEKVLGKFVFWDQSGLIVIGDEEALTPEDKGIIEALVQAAL